MSPIQPETDFAILVADNHEIWVKKQDCLDYFHKLDSQKHDIKNVTQLKYALESYTPCKFGTTNSGAPKIDSITSNSSFDETKLELFGVLFDLAFKLAKRHKIYVFDFTTKQWVNYHTKLFKGLHGKSIEIIDENGKTILYYMLAIANATPRNSMNMNGLDLYDFHARQYDPALGRFTTPDPLSEKYYHISPYAYCANNPINAIDPNGMNPIYDINGNFLGTDDKGIAGSYVIMNKNDFVQGMSHKSALEKQYLNAIENDARQKIWDHHATLDTRPDYDGYVSISEGVDWAKSHPGALQNPTPNNTLYVDASKLNFSSISTSDFVQEGKATSVNLFSLKSFVLDFLSYDRRNTVYALGRVDLILLSREHRTIKIVNNEATDYDWNVGGGKYRNLFINLERGRTGLEDNHGFKVFYYGIGKLNE